MEKIERWADVVARIVAIFGVQLPKVTPVLFHIVSTGQTKRTLARRNRDGQALFLVMFFAGPTLDLCLAGSLL